MKIAIYAGTFDPFTLGHESIVEAGSKLFDKVIVLIAYNANKKGMFTLNQRKKQIEEVIHKYPNVELRVITDEFVASVAAKQKAGYLIRGIRDSVDYEYEQKIEKINKKINPNLQTVYISAPVELSEISSSMVKSLVGFAGWQKIVSTMVNERVLSDLMRAKDEEFVSAAWKKIAGDDKVSQKWLEKILHDYSQTHRHYHNLSHIVELLKQADELMNNSNFNSIHKAIIKYSIFFHDIVYNPQNRDNEKLSAELFMEFAQELNLTQVIFEGVYESIIATANHSEKPKFEITEYFLDLDLSILGAEPSKFESYEDQIRQEYNFVPEEIFNIERSKIMQKLVNPYKTEYGKQKYGSQALFNLKKYEQ